MYEAGKIQVDEPFFEDPPAEATMIGRGQRPKRQVAPGLAAWTVVGAGAFMRAALGQTGPAPKGNSTRRTVPRPANPPDLHSFPTRRSSDLEPLKHLDRFAYVRCMKQARSRWTNRSSRTPRRRQP